MQHMLALTEAHFLGGSHGQVRTVHQVAGPERQVPVRLDPHDPRLHPLPRAQAQRQRRRLPAARCW